MRAAEVSVRDRVQAPGPSSQRRARARLACAVVAAFFASVFPPVQAQQATASPSPYFSTEADPAAFEFFVPVLVMEQFAAPHTDLQAYRIRLFSDGRGFYDGLNRVRTFGEVAFRIRPEEVQELLNEFRKYKYWQMPENMFGEPVGQGVLAVEFRLRDGHLSKTVRFGGSYMDFQDIFQDLVEKRANSARWRCPVLQDGTSRELCARHDAVVQQGAEAFLKNWPRIKESF